jgi:uncharacterized protein (TIGR03083 family)
VELTPRYDAAPCLVVDGDVDELRTAVLRQRRRAVEAFGSLTADEWTAQSRCSEWRARDVVAHLIDTDGYWDMSLQAGLSGAPTRFLGGFDPARTPALLAAASAEQSTDELHARYVQVVEGLCATIERIDDDGWRALAEAPPGHIPVASVVHHALWDSWVHERDVFVPMGVEPPVEPDEVLASLAYAAGLGPAFDLVEGRSGRLVVAVADAATDIVVDVGTSVHVSRRSPSTGTDGLRLTGDAVALAEMFSVRRPFDVGDLGEGAWLVAGLISVFES